MVVIDSRDWQGLLDKLERLTVAAEAIAVSVSNMGILEKATEDFKKHSQDLKAVLPPTT